MLLVCCFVTSLVISVRFGATLLLMAPDNQDRGPPFSLRLKNLSCVDRPRHKICNGSNGFMGNGHDHEEACDVQAN